jgi:hypothetical protein
MTTREGRGLFATGQTCQRPCRCSGFLAASSRSQKAIPSHQPRVARAIERIPLTAVLPNDYRHHRRIPWHFHNQNVDMCANTPTAPSFTSQMAKHVVVEMIPTTVGIAKNVVTLGTWANVFVVCDHHETMYHFEPTASYDTHLRKSNSSAILNGWSEVSHVSKSLSHPDKSFSLSTTANKRRTSTSNLSFHLVLLARSIPKSVAHIGRWALFTGGLWPPKQGRGPVAIKTRHARRIRGKKVL